MKYIEDYKEFEEARKALRKVCVDLEEQQSTVLEHECEGVKRYNISRISQQIGVLEAALAVLDLL